MLIYLVLLTINILWILLLLLGPVLCLVTPEHVLLIKVYYSLLHLICHQKPERSYFFLGFQLPVCARCIGLYTGSLIGLLLYPLFKSLSNIRIPNLKYYFLFLTPMAIDGICQTIGLYTTSNIFRTIIGIVASAPAVFYLIPVINQIYNRLNNQLTKS